jgi:hypothetical protein
MTPEPWETLILECLTELADVEFQTGVWLRAEVPKVMSSPIDAVCGLYDDSGSVILSTRAVCSRSAGTLRCETYTR